MVFLLIIGASVHKHILLSRVSMDVTKQSDFAFFLKLLHHFFGMENSGMDKLVGIVPPPVQVHSQQGGPVVPINNAIRV